MYMSNNQGSVVFSLLFYYEHDRKHHYNISGILNGLQVGYDKRVRPNYGGKFVRLSIGPDLSLIGSLVGLYD